MMGPVSQSATAASKYYYEKDPLVKKITAGGWAGFRKLSALETGATVLKDDFNNIINGNDLSGGKVVQDTYTAQASRTSCRC